jgi:predicted outer membrane protein
MPLFIALIISALCALPCLLRGSDTSTLSPVDLDFFKQAISINVAEIRFAHVALSRHLMAPAEELANSMVTTHSAALKTLLALSQAKKSGLSAEIQADEPLTVDGLTGLADSEVPERFIKMQIDCLKRTIAIYTVEINDGIDMDLKEFAATALPQLRVDLDAAQVLEAKH